MNDDHLMKVPPHSEPAELSVIGGILLHNECLDEVADILGPQDFYSEKHAKIYEAMLELYNAGKPIDVITLPERLKVNGSLGDAGGLEYLTGIMDKVPTAANIETHARVVAEKAIVRAVLRICMEGLGEGHRDVPEPAEWVSDLSARLDRITERKTEEGVLSLHDGLLQTMKQMSDEASNDIEEIGVLTGFGDLDRMLGCLHRGDLHIIAGRPSMGKTALSIDIAMNAGAAGTAVHFFSLEMSADQLRRRMISARSRVEAFKIRNPWLLRDEEWDRVREASEEISGYPITIDDSRRLDVVNIRARARRLKRKLGALGLLIIDYLSLVRAIRRFKEMNREREVAEIVTALRALAQELDVPVVLLCQLNRNTESRKDKRPTLADLRESGEIEQIADVILFLYREAAYEIESESNTAELILAKQRNGDRAILDMVFLKDYASFVQMDEGDKDKVKKQRRSGSSGGSKFKGFTARIEEPMPHPAEPPERDDGTPF
jgi:replicative DNA helicase